MRPLAVASLFAAAAALGACQPGAAPSPSGDEAPAEASGPSGEAEGSNTAGEAEGSTTASEAGADAPDEPAIGSGDTTGPVDDDTVTIGAASTTDVSAPLLLAVETQDPEVAEEALRTLSRNLATWRRRPTPDLVEAVRAFAGASSAPLWRQVDARFVPPAIELLLEIRDMAAVARLTSAFAESAAEPALRGPRALVARDTTPRAGIEAEPGCALHVDGAPVDGAADVLVGSHQAGCGPDDQRLVVLFANERIAVGPDAVRVIEGDDTE